MVSMNELAEAIHEIALKRGWWQGESNFGEMLALVHSEVSEALEEYRDHHGFNEVYWLCSPNPGVLPYIACHDSKCTNDRKPEGIPIELADIMIRVLDLCGYYQINIEQAMAAKINYNTTRPERHGGKRV